MLTVFWQSVVLNCIFPITASAGSVFGRVLRGATRFAAAAGICEAGHFVLRQNDSERLHFGAAAAHEGTGIGDEAFAFDR